MYSTGREFPHALADVGEDHRDEILESTLFAEDVRADVERVAEERLQRLEQSSRRGCVGEDLRLDGLLPRVR
jgi:hypothetical protein